MLLGLWTLTLWSIVVFVAGSLFGAYVWSKIKKNLK
jgi:hypothetical protein